MQKPAEICAWTISINTHQPEGKQCCRNGSSNSQHGPHFWVIYKEKLCCIFSVNKSFTSLLMFSSVLGIHPRAYGKDTLYHRATSPTKKDARVSNYDPFLLILWLFLLVEKYHLNLIVATILYTFIKIQLVLPLKMIKFCYKLNLNRSQQDGSAENGPCLLPTFRNLWSYQDPRVS